MHRPATVGTTLTLLSLAVQISCLVICCHSLIVIPIDRLKQTQKQLIETATSSNEHHQQPEPHQHSLTQDCVHALESDGLIRYSGVKELSQLAPQSLVQQLIFSSETLPPPSPPPPSSLSNLNSRSDNVNKTKQSQDFDTHQGQQQQQQQQGSSLKPVAISSNLESTTPTASPTASPSPPVAATSHTQAISVAGTGTGSGSTTSQELSTTSEAATTPTTTTTAATTAATTIAGWPQRPTSGTTTTTELPGHVGSKTERQGAAVLCGEANANGKSNRRLISDRIVGGHKTEPGEFPFQVRLNIRSRRGSGICGGVVLDGRHILTAAHCMTACVSQHLTTATIESSGVKATIGDHSIKSNDGEQELDVESITPHQKYDACNFYANDHDIAIIKTVQPIEYKFTSDGYGSINRPCMPSGTGGNNNNSSLYADGEQVIVSGWGVTRENSGTLSNILRYVQVPIVNVTRCQETYGSRVTHDHICAGYTSGGKDSCQGDSGGPLVRVVDNRYELVGIVSFGYGCGQPGAPGVYTRVASYLDWIKANL